MTLGEFLDKIDNFCLSQNPKDLTIGSVYDELAKAMWDKFVENRQSEKVFRNKINLWKALNDQMKVSFPRHVLFITGSTLSGFEGNTGDLDMSVIVNDLENNDRRKAITGLENLVAFIKKDSNIYQFELIKSTVPLIKFHHTLFDVRVDLSYNNRVNIRNTHLLYHYAKVDWRVQPLVLIVKLWAKVQDINDAWHQTISSYSLILMVINFLQCGVQPAVLPCLQSLFGDKFRSDSDIEKLEYIEDLVIPGSAMPYRNEQTLGELFIRFLKYYDSFEYDKYVISIRLGRTIPMKEFRNMQAYMSEPYRWKCLCIEEPFTLTNTARAVYKPIVFSRIKKVFNKSYQTVNNTHDLASTFVKFD